MQNGWRASLLVVRGGKCPPPPGRGVSFEREKFRVKYIFWRKIAPPLFLMTWIPGREFRSREKSLGKYIFWVNRSPPPFLMT